MSQLVKRYTATVFFDKQEWVVDHLVEILLEFFPRIAGYSGRGVITTATY